ncbi:ABC transporter permease [Phytomonospora endophytica]|uniref:ABC-type dipeptide/oligopeptide/nickel transport system permease subunit n=1 Tax=Phytomonospora endophytica TaxID=714109 RepID=A0A841FI46_9ACTN|nr:ABC transporter permease [Phytomonospora endophytica]MBB6033252.1 ABC-type dipeptide/oligopeptide/nickel transport system permease subunit [Phytomonospora endophytica]GIG65478.1 peptide ABC transporter permease [Phytomonospora endophytica]
MSDANVQVTAAVVPKTQKTRSLWSDAFHDLRKRPTVVISALVILVMLLIGFFPGLFNFQGQNPKACDLALTRGGMSGSHWFGFDEFGCDYYAQAIYGAGPSIQLAIIVVTATLLIGGLFGVLAGFYGGWVDAIFSRAVDVFNSIPFLLGAMLLLTMFRDWKIPGLGTRFQAIIPAAITLIIFSWTGTMRLIRASVIESRGLDYVQAARSLGASDRRIMFRHILPNAMAPVVSLIPLSIAGMITAEASLSFLGLGVRPPEITWGMMISTGAGYFTTGYPRLLLVPSAFLIITILAFVLLGDAIRDALDPKLR